MRDDARTNAPIFLTPDDLCRRWNISMRTLDKFELPWRWLRPRIRRIALVDVEAFERQQHLVRQST